MENPVAGDMLNFEGPDGETLFRRFLGWCLSPDSIALFQQETDAAFEHMRSEDDRALALVGALVIENAVDGLLSAFIPGYSSLKDNRDFSLSMKIGLARALRLCPSRLLGAADAIRNIRNDFAHRLTITTFEECQPKHLRSIEGHLRQMNANEAQVSTPRAAYRTLAGLVFIALRGYTVHVERLNHFVRQSEDFRAAFMTYCQSTFPQLADGDYVEV